MGVRFSYPRGGRKAEGRFHRAESRKREVSVAIFQRRPAGCRPESIFSTRKNCRAHGRRPSPRRAGLSRGVMSAGNQRLSGSERRPRPRSGVRHSSRECALKELTTFSPPERLEKRARHRANPDEKRERKNSPRSKEPAPLYLRVMTECALPLGRRRYAPLVLLAGLLAVGGLAGCKRASPEPTPREGAERENKEESPAAPKSAQTAPGSFPAPEISWTKPSSWLDGPKSAVRAATYRATGSAGEAEITVFYFGPSSGGGVDANISRWIAQFQGITPEDAERDQLTVQGFRVTTVRVRSGTFSSGMPGGPTTPKENYGLYAAVVETPSGAYFFKMTGPKDTVTSEEKNFVELLQSVRPRS
jgi:hypothetical protein